MDVTVNAGLCQKLSSPNPFALVTSFDGEKTNVMALSWWTYCSNHPMTVAICCGQRSYTGDCVAKNQQFCICLPGKELAEAAFRAGTCTGAKLDKVKELGLAMQPASAVKPGYVSGSKLVMECEVVQTVAVGDHRMFIAEVVATHCDDTVEHLLAFDGYSRLAPAKKD